VRERERERERWLNACLEEASLIKEKELDSDWLAIYIA